MADPVFPAYDATYAFTHLLRTLQAQQTPSGPKFDATTAISAVLKTVAAGGTVPAAIAVPVTGSQPRPGGVPPTFRVEPPKDNKSKGPK